MFPDEESAMKHFKIHYEVKMGKIDIVLVAVV